MSKVVCEDHLPRCWAQSPEMEMEEHRRSCRWIWQDGSTARKRYFPVTCVHRYRSGPRKREILQKNHSAATSTVFLKLSTSLHEEAQRAAGEKFNHRKVQENRRREEGSRIALTSSARFWLLELRTSESYRVASTCTLSERQQRMKTWQARE